MRNRLPRIALVSAATLLAVCTVLALSGVSAWEKAVFVAINGVNGPEWLTSLARLGSDLVWVAVGVVVVLLVFWKKARRNIWNIAVAAGGSYVAVFLLEHIIGRDRPEFLLAASDVIQRASQGGYGFPSGHMATITAIIILAWPRLNVPLKVVAASILLLAAWSRVYLGVHFPLDMVGGAAVAVIVVATMKLLPRRMRTLLFLEERLQKTEN